MAAQAGTDGTPVVPVERGRPRRAPGEAFGSRAYFDLQADPTACVVRYSHLGREPGLLAYPNLAALDDGVIASLLGCGVRYLGEVRAALAKLLDAACDELLADEEFDRDVRSLPLSPGDVVVTVGDSITADALSWANLLALALRRTGQAVEVINAGVSSNTTSDLIANFETVVASHPSYVIAMIGTNDARRHGPGGKARMTSAGETERRLRAYSNMVRSLGRAQLVLLTPPPVDEARARQHAAFVERRVSWRLSEVAGVGALVRRQRARVVDVYRAFLGQDLAACLTADGVHPSLAGQKLILRTLARAWADDSGRPTAV